MNGKKSSLSSLVSLPFRIVRIVLQFALCWIIIRSASFSSFTMATSTKHIFKIELKKKIKKKTF